MDIKEVGISCGMIIPFAGNGPIPQGFLLCNGAEVYKDTYPSLFEAIGYTYGGSGNVFNLPDLRDKFIEGAIASGENKAAGLPNIEGEFQARGHANNGEYNGALTGASGALEYTQRGGAYGDYGVAEGNVASTNGKVVFDASRSSGIYGSSDTVQPAALTMRYIIRAFGGLSDGRGLSAYEVAVLNGYEGSETEWLASLRGPAGPAGPVGPQGQMSAADLERIAQKVDKASPRMSNTAIVRLDNLNADGNTESVWGNVLAVEDKQGRWFAYWQAENHGWDQSNYTALNLTNGDAKASLGLTVKPNGYAYAEAPTPADNASGTEIATVAWVINKVNQQGKIDDVQINGTSIKNGTVANIPLSSALTYANGGVLGISVPTESLIINRSSARALMLSRLDYAVKRAMCDGKGAEWTDTEKAGAWKRFAIVKTTLDEIAIAGAGYFLGTQTNVNITLPTDAEVGQEISVSWYNGGTPATLSIDGDMLDFDYTPSSNTRSEINALWDGMYWAIIGNEMGVAND